MRFTDDQRKMISDQATGKLVESLVYEPDGDYWVMTFEDESEISFRFMAELAR